VAPLLLFLQELNTGSLTSNIASIAASLAFELGQDILVGLNIGELGFDVPRLTVAFGVHEVLVSLLLVAG